jgi:phosphate uptake regulator
MLDIEREQMDNDIRLLADRVVDLGLYVEEMFKNAISLLFTRDWSNVYTLAQTAPDVAPVTLVSEAMQIMARWAPTQERLRTVVVLQQAADELGTILNIIASLAEKARGMENNIEDYFQQIGPVGQQGFYRLLQSAHIQLRGCVVALSTRQASMANKVILQDGVMDQAYMQMQGAVRAAMMAEASLTVHLGRLSIVIADIEQIGNHITRICQRIETITQGPSYDDLPAVG